jgi:hypothetical protein
MARLTADQLRAVKEAKQKKVLIALAPLLLGLLAWQGPKTYNALAGEPPPPPVVPGSTATAPVDLGTAPPPLTPTGVTPPPAGATGLPDTDVPVSGADGQLISFSRFTSKDPFEQPSSSSGSPSGTDDGGSDGGAANTAVLVVNGQSESVKVGSSFPAGDPTFRLVSISGETAKVGLVSGSFSGGAETIDLNVGETLVLVADPDGKRYAIKLESVAFVQ